VLHYSHAQTSEEILNAIKEADTYLTMLHDFSAMGAAMRQVMTGALTNPQVLLLLFT
jgi:E3 ubiquitin-protein ligase UBR3